MREIEKSSFLYGSNAVFIEELYNRYIEDRSCVDKDWADYFDTFGESEVIVKPSWGICPNVIKESERIYSDRDESANIKLRCDNDVSDISTKVMMLINGYRERGHFISKLDPLHLEDTSSVADINLTLEHFSLSKDDLKTKLHLNDKYSGSLEVILAKLQKTYSSTVGFEFAQVEDLSVKQWLYDKVENGLLINNDDKIDALQDLVEIEGFEQYLHVKFPGAKRFSIEGVDTAILSIKKIVEYAADSGMSGAVIGMAHRGRLSTLVKIMQKSYRAIFAEFMGKSAIPEGFDISGDVKYHMGYSSDIITKACNKIHLSLMYNPSHLEAVNPVVAGSVRAKQDIIEDLHRSKTMGILIHGDAAFCGQGIVQESLMMSGLSAYNTGGIIHIITNNQVGFTANPNDQHIGRYATDIAKAIGAPIIHVNAEDVESVIFATKIAFDYKAEFKKDIVLDIIGYRKYGHNEGDEPMYTQPRMYNVIKDKKAVAEIYANNLRNRDIITQDHYRDAKEQFRKFLDSEYTEAKDYKSQSHTLSGLWSGYKHTKNESLGLESVTTGIDLDIIKDLVLKLCSIPNDFAIHPKIDKILSSRVDAIESGNNIDWATAEHLAFATLLKENIPVRLIGEDAGRGTFSHRHSVLHSQNSLDKYIPLNNLSEAYAKYEVADSNLSEYAALGFEYGYSLVNPKHLVIWEAQFGDFANGAQIIFDQFISSAETKWLRMSGIVVMLPHGFEGMGPEHSSARIERFLQLAAEFNIQVTTPTTPASLFHLLRRQMHRDFMKPLIIMTPKSLLRHKLVTSPVAHFDESTCFNPIISEIDDIDNAIVRRVIICSGKVYYDLLEARRHSNIRDIAIIRLEQIYPFPVELLSCTRKYTKVKDFIWCQEEPKNMGAWSFIEGHLRNLFGDIRYVGRCASASPATGSAYIHAKEQKELISEALDVI